MATLTVNGVKVTVDDSFRSLSPEQQEATVNEIASQIGSQKAPESKNSGGFLGTADALSRSIASGALLGFDDEIFAGLDSLGSKVVPWRDEVSYEDALRKVRGDNKAAVEEYPVTSLAGGVVGNLGLGGAALKAAPKVGGIIMGNGGATTAQRAAVAGGSGLGFGFAQGFGNGEGGAMNRAQQGAKEGAYGAALGMGLVPVAAVAGKAVNAASQRLFGQTDDALSGVSKDASRYLTEELSDPAKVAQYRQSLDELGPEATLADVSPEWLGVARGAAARPGTRGIVVDPLQERAGLANDRLRGDLSATVGRDPIPSSIERGLEDSRRMVAERYGPVMGQAGPVNTQPLAEGLDEMSATLRGPERQSVMNVRGYLNTPGKAELDTDPRSLLSTRQAIDGLLANETNPQVVRQLTLARQEVDSVLAGAAPGIKDVDGQYRELARQSEGLEQGRPILNNGATAMRPQELGRMMIQGGLPEGNLVGPSGAAARMRQGTTGELYRAVGTKANDTTALRQIVRGEGDWNRDKLGMLYGRENADRLLGAIDRESVFGDTANRVTRGSDTAMAGRFSTFLDDVARSQEAPNDTTLTGLGMTAGRAILRSLMQSNAGANAGRLAEDLGRVSVARGPERDALVDAILKMGERNVISKERQKVIDALAQSFGRSAYPSLPGARD